MARYKSVEKGQGYLLAINPDELFDEYSIEMVINKFIDTFVDLEKFDSKYHNDSIGQKAISPLVMLKILTYHMSQNEQSIRKIEKMQKLNHPGYWFLSGGRIIDHSTLCNFLNTFQDEIQLIFSKLLMVMDELKIIDWNKIMIDGTKISSNASKTMTDNAKGFKTKMKQYKVLSEKLVTRTKILANKQTNGEINETQFEDENKRINRQKEQYERVLGKIKEYESDLTDGEVTPDEKINLTDKDSRLLKKEDGFVQGYNVQAAFSGNDILLAIDAADESNDMNMSRHMIEKTEAVSDKAASADYLLDKGYFKPEMISELIDSGRNMYVAAPVHFTDSWFLNGTHTIVIEDGKPFFACKQGRQKAGRYDAKEKRYEFRVEKNFCKECENPDLCWKDKDAVKKRKFVVSKSYIDHEHTLKEYLSKIQKEDWTFTYNKRIGKEHNFQDLKSNNGLQRLNWRGKSKCNTIVHMAGLAFNLKKFRKHIVNIGWDPVLKLAAN